MLMHSCRLEEFNRLYGAPNKPVIITDAIEHWKAKENWNIPCLVAHLLLFQIQMTGKQLQQYAVNEFKVDDVDEDGHKMRMRLDDYVHYMHTNHDEDPIYLFDPKFHTHAPTLLQDYEVHGYWLHSYSDDSRYPYTSRMITCPHWVIVDLTIAGL